MFPKSHWCLAIALLVLAIGVPAVAQTSEETLTLLKTRTDGFFRNLKEGVEPERAFEALLADGPLAPDAGDGRKRRR